MSTRAGENCFPRCASHQKCCCLEGWVSCSLLASPCICRVVYSSLPIKKPSESLLARHISLFWNTTASTGAQCRSHWSDRLSEHWQSWGNCPTFPLVATASEQQGASTPSGCH